MHLNETNYEEDLREGIYLDVVEEDTQDVRARDDQVFANVSEQCRIAVSEVKQIVKSKYI